MSQQKLTSASGEVVKGGGIVLKQEDGKSYVLLIYRGNHKDWSFPKGHAESDESSIETVVREIKEECGIETEITRELPPNKYFNTKTNEETVTHMYLLKPKSFKLRQEHGGDKVEWVPIDEVKDRLTYENLKNYFTSVKSEI